MARHEKISQLGSREAITAERPTPAEGGEEAVLFLAEIGEVLAASLDWEATLVRVARLAIPALADWCIVDVLDEDGETIRQVAVAAVDSHKEDVLREMRLLYPPTLDSPQPAARALRAGAPVVFPDFDLDALAGTTRDERHLAMIKELDPSSAIAVPLVARGHTLGAMTLAWAESERRYSDAEVALAAELARRAAIAVDNATLYAREREARSQAERAAERLRELETVSEAALVHLELDPLLHDLLDRIRSVMRADTAVALLLDPGGRELVASWSRGLEEEVEAGVRIPVGKGFAGRVAAQRRPVVIPDVGQAELFNPLIVQKGLRSLLGVPLLVEGRLLGVLHVGSLEYRVFGEEDQRTLQLLADRVALAIQQSRLYREAERRADAARVLDHVGDGVILLDSSGVIRLWNRAAEAITRLPVEEVVGRSVAEAVPGWEQIADRVPITSTPTAGARAETLPLELPTGEVWLSIAGVEFAEGTVYAFRDLTEERVLEQLKSDFVSTVSHELRTPLAAIYGAAVTLRREDLRLEESQRDNLLGVIASEADRLARIVDDILWASRLDADRLQVSIVSCDAGELTRSVVDAARAHLPEAIDLTIAVEPDLPPVAGDPDKVRQALSNLVDNAIKYSPDGGPVDVVVSRRERAVRFTVRDEGLGIPPAEQRRIFDKFYRLDPNLTRGVGGTGLGLYICRELARRMDGRIWVESREGEGSTFGFELPAAAATS